MTSGGARDRTRKRANRRVDFEPTLARTSSPGLSPPCAFPFSPSPSYCRLAILLPSSFHHLHLLLISSHIHTYAHISYENNSTEGIMFHLANKKLNAAGLAPEHSKALPERQPEEDEKAIMQALVEVSYGTLLQLD